jgi:hypothetical protein
MHVLNRLMIVILLMAALGLTGCTGTDLSGTAGDVGDEGNPAAAVAGDEGEDDAVGEGEVGDAAEGDALGESGEDDAKGDGAEDDAAGEGEGDEAAEGDAEEGDVEEEDGDREGETEGDDAEDDAVGEAEDDGEGEDDAVVEAGGAGADVLPLAPAANAQAALDALASVRFDTLSWRDLGDRVDQEDMAALESYFEMLSRSDLSLPDCEGCLDTINVLLGGQAARVDDITTLMSAVVANG